MLECPGDDDALAPGAAQARGAGGGWSRFQHAPLSWPRHCRARRRLAALPSPAGRLAARTAASSRISGGGCARLGRPAGPWTPNPRPTRPPRAGRKTKCAKPGTASFGARPRRTRHTKNGCRFARARRVYRPGASRSTCAFLAARGASTRDAPLKPHPFSRKAGQPAPSGPAPRRETRRGGPGPIRRTPLQGKRPSGRDGHSARATLCHMRPDLPCRAGSRRKGKAPHN